MNKHKVPPTLPCELFDIAFYNIMISVTLETFSVKALLFFPQVSDNKISTSNNSQYIQCHFFLNMVA